MKAMFRSLPLFALIIVFGFIHLEMIEQRNEYKNEAIEQTLRAEAFNNELKNTRIQNQEEKEKLKSEFIFSEKKYIDTINDLLFNNGLLTDTIHDLRKQASHFEQRLTLLNQEKKEGERIITKEENNDSNHNSNTTNEQENHLADSGNVVFSSFSFGQYVFITIVLVVMILKYVTANNPLIRWKF
jgi:hypothetical protein